MLALFSTLLSIIPCVWVFAAYKLLLKCITRYWTRIVNNGLKGLSWYEDTLLQHKSSIIHLYANSEFISQGLIGLTTLPARLNGKDY